MDNSPTSMSEQPKEAWQVTQRAHNGRPMFLRINAALKPLVGKPPFEHRFGVAIPLRAPNEHGLPAREESDQLNTIEDALTAAVMPSGKTHFAIVITTSGFRELVFYTAAPREIVAIMEKFKEQTVSHKIQFYVRPDPAWDVYKASA